MEEFNLFADKTALCYVIESWFDIRVAMLWNCAP